MRAAAAYSVDIPLGLRRLCAARLIAQADNLDKQQQHQQQAQGSTGRHAGLATQLQPRHDYLGGVVELVVTLQQAAAVRLATVGDGEDEAAEAAQQAAGTLQQTLQRMHGQLQAESVDASKQQRLRALTHLLRLLLLHTLADPTTADVSLAADLDQVAALSLESSAAAQQRSPEAASSDEEDAAEPHWHDTLMDVLLSLLARNAAPLPSAPLRDAVEHVFRCFADDLTATGEKVAGQGAAVLWNPEGGGGSR